VTRRNLIPLLLVAVLGVLALGFAVLGAANAPSGASVTVQNASTTTFGSPTGSNSFTMDIVSTVAGGGSATLRQVRLIVYRPPSHMAVYEAGKQPRFLGFLGQDAIDCDLTIYTSLVGGSTAWNPAGSGVFRRTESLADYSARIPRATASTCTSVASPVHGQVDERASVREGYLVGLRLTVIVPAQSLPGGQPAAHGVEGQELVLTEIAGTRTRTLGH
jgi:hypothetical protein